MKWQITFRLTIICFVFIILLTSIFLGISLIFLLSYIGIETGYQQVHIPFIFNILIVSTFIGTVIAAFFSKRFFKPMQNVIDGTKIVAKGNFNYRVKKQSHHDSEINQLIDSFNQMIEELSSIEMFRNDFISNFSHEFKTPIAAIIGYAKELERDDLSEEERDKYLSIIISESERLSTLSSNILFLTKIENQKILSNKTTFSLDEQLRNCILALQQTWEQKEIDWDLNLNEINYLGDEDLLAQAWTNILSNAIKFSHQKGKISVSCEIINHHDVLVRISDFGIGMDDKTLEHAFDKFYQGDTSHHTKGNGLGLSLVKKIIELCGADISLRSKENSGTIVSVTLPLKDA